MRTEFKSLTFQVFGDESELRENTETGFVNMGWDEDAATHDDILSKDESELLSRYRNPTGKQEESCS